VLQGTEQYGDNIFSSGTLRGRLGYVAPGSWLFYVTGGLAVTNEQYTLATNPGAMLGGSVQDSSFQQRVGWVVGAGIEAPLIPHWTVKAEYLYANYGNNNGIEFPDYGQVFTSNLTEQQVRVGVNYHYNEQPAPSSSYLFGFDPDIINIHGQTTAVWQGYPAFHQVNGSILPPPASLGFPNGGQGREIGEGTLYLGARLWKGAEVWINPEIDQGLGLNEDIGVSAFPNSEAFKLGSSQPYVKIQRAFVRQTIDLGGAPEKVDADINWFANTTTEDRLVLTFGRLSPLDIFDTNKYANSPKSQFLNWGLLYALPFDWGGDAWGFGWGAASELYKGPFAFRVAYFDTEQSAIADALPFQPAFGVDPTFRQYDIMGEAEYRYALWGEPGKVKVTVNWIGAELGSYAAAIADAEALSPCSIFEAGGTPGIPALACVRTYKEKVDAHIGFEQDITKDIGIFSRVGIHPSYVEDLAITDNVFFASGGASFSGRLWGRPGDTVGVGGIYQTISKEEQQYLALGGLGSFIGDGQLANPAAEEVFETYYSIQLLATTYLTFDYQLFANPAYNGDRGPINLFATRIHWQF
jgi:high affinity Mn2+ porin